MKRRERKLSRKRHPGKKPSTDYHLRVSEYLRDGWRVVQNLHEGPRRGSILEYEESRIYVDWEGRVERLGGCGEACRR